MKKFFIFLSLVAFSLLFSNFSQIALAEDSADFSDVAKNHKYYGAIKSLTDDGILVGYEDGSFLPNKPVTRAEFIKIVIAYNDPYYYYEFGDEDCFADVAGHWGEDVICYAYSRGVIHGDGMDGLFHPERLVSLVEAAKIVNYMEKAKWHDDYNDDSDATPWYQPSIDYLGKVRAIPGTITDLNQEISRSEATELLWRTGNEIEPNTAFNTFSPLGELASLESINDSYSKKGNMIYNRKFELVSSDFDNLDFLSEYLAVDDSNVYLFSSYGEVEILEEIDVESFEMPENNLVYSGLIGYASLEILFVRDDVNNYLLLSSDLFDGKGNLWREAMSIEDTDLVFNRVSDNFATLTIPDSSGEEVAFVGKHHFTVGEKVYYLNNEIEEVDFESFEVYTIGENLYWMQAYSRDSDNVYYKGEIVKEADPDSFSETSSSWYYQDKNYVYNGDGEMAEGSDSQTFEIIDNYYAADENHVYMYGYLVEGADPETFVDQDYQCSYDEDSYFLRDQNDINRPYAAEVTEDVWEASCE